MWSVLGPDCGIHLSLKMTPFDKWVGGIEFHRGFMVPGDRAPDHINCWLIGRPCWHDGSSLQVEERWIPLWEANIGDHEMMLTQLLGELNELRQLRT